MAKTKASKAAPKAERASARASPAKRAAASAKGSIKGARKRRAAGKPKGGEAAPRAEGAQSARSRLVELKRRIREMANLNAPSDVVAVKSSPRANGRTKPATPAAAARPAGGVTAESRLAELKRRLQEASDIAAAGAVLSWDQATYMPKGGAGARARQGATLSRLAH